VVFDLLVRSDPSDEQDVRESIIESGFECGTGSSVPHSIDVDDDRADPRVLEAELLELPSVVLGIAEGEIDLAGETFEFRPSQRSESKNVWVVRSEEMSRCDVVILEDPPMGEASKGLAHWRRHREVQDGDVAEPRRRFCERTNFVRKVIVDGQSEDV
jgi:hypothetical protein